MKIFGERVEGHAGHVDNVRRLAEAIRVPDYPFQVFVDFVGHVTQNPQLVFQLPGDLAGLVQLLGELLDGRGEPVYAVFGGC